MLGLFRCGVFAQRISAHQILCLNASLRFKTNQTLRVQPEEHFYVCLQMRTAFKRFVSQSCIQEAVRVPPGRGADRGERRLGAYKAPREQKTKTTSAAAMSSCFALLRCIALSLSLFVLLDAAQSRKQSQEGWIDVAAVCPASPRPPLPSRRAVL